MNIYQRAKNLLLAPAKEWQSIDEEDVNSSHVLTYLLVLALIPAVAGFIGMGFIGLNVFGIDSVSWGFRNAISSYLGIVGGAYISAFVIDFLADKFQATSSFNVAFKVVAYSYTPMCGRRILPDPLALVSGSPCRAVRTLHIVHRDEAHAKSSGR